MYRGFILVGFAVFTAAVPLDKSSDDSMYQASYHPYYNYGSYPSAVKAEAAKIDTVKRGYKRHTMRMPKEVMDKIASSSEKRDIHNEVQAAGDTWYERYE
jgi:hypothetical protein